MMSLQVVFCVWMLFSAEAEESRVLLVLSTGTDLYGEIVQEAAGDVFITRQGKPVRIDGRSIVKRVGADEIDAEIKERQKDLAEGDIAGCLRLALLCLEVERPKEATPFIEKARVQVKAMKPGAAKKKTDATVAAGKDKTNANGKADAKDKAAPKEAALPWPPEPGATFCLQVKRKVDADVTDDGVRESRLRNLFATGGTPFEVSDGAAGADYVIRIGLEAVMVKENTYYGSVPISREWEGKVSCVVRHVKTDREVFRMSPVVVRDTLPLVAKSEEALTKAWEQFMRLFRNEAVFRFKKEDTASATGTLRTR